MLLLSLFSSSFAGVVINEVLYDVSGTDTGNEWVELYNNGSGPVDLMGFELQAGTSSFKKIYSLSAAYTLQPGDYVLVGGPSATYPGAFDTDLNNASSSVVGVRLLDASGAVVDTMMYGGPSNPNGLADDLGVADPARAASATASDASLGRTDGIDTNDSSVDFVEWSTPTPGAENKSNGGGGGTTADCTASGSVRINEFLPDPDGSDDGAEWVELYNNTSVPALVGGWALQWDTSDLINGPSSFTLPEGTEIPAMGYLVLGAGGLSVSLGLGNASSSGDGVRLVCDTTVVDTVIYGDNNDDGFSDDSGGNAVSLAPQPSSGESLVRKVDGVDTDRSGDDFFSCSQPSPGAANLCVPHACTVEAGGVLINEFTPQTDAEWVELYNPGSTSIDLSGWTLAYATSASSGVKALAALPANTVLEAGAYFVLGTPTADASYLNYEVDIDLGNATTNGDALQLWCGDEARVIDTVVYAKSGKTNDDGWLDDNGEAASSLAPTPEDGGSTQRIPNGVDTNESGHDFQATLSPTPGAENQGSSVNPGECDADGVIKVNEVMYDSTADDATNEWVELYNAGDVPVDLAGYTLEAAKSSWATNFYFAESAVLQPGEFYLIGAEDVLNANAIAEDLDLGNGTSADGVRILDCAGTVLDTVLYGEPLDDEISGDEGSVEVVATATTGQSIGRYPDGLDNNAASDWKFYAAPTPGAPNTAITNYDPDCPTSGCAKSDDPRCPVNGNCSTAMLPLGGWEAGLGLLVLLRRRRE